MAKVTATATAVSSSRLTISLALRHFPQLDQGEVVEMEVGKTVVVDDPAGAFSVTAYDANHCPGAVMYLFEGEFGSILHMGDCRLTQECVQNLPLKYIAKKGKENICHLDFLFLDCTFSKCFLKLPSKESAIQQVFLYAEVLHMLAATCRTVLMTMTAGKSPLRNDSVIAGYSLHMEASACTFRLSCS